jgi:hypothetical protein
MEHFWMFDIFQRVWGARMWGHTSTHAKGHSRPDCTKRRLDRDEQKAKARRKMAAHSRKINRRF